MLFELEVRISLQKFRPRRASDRARWITPEISADRRIDSYRDYWDAAEELC